MKTKHVLILILISIALTWFVTWYYSNDADIVEQLKESEAHRELLQLEIDTLHIENKRLEVLKNEVVIQYKYIYKTSKAKDDEIQNTTNNAYNVDEREIDSTIRQYTHKPYIRKQKGDI